MSSAESTPPTTVPATRDAWYTKKHFDTGDGALDDPDLFELKKGEPTPSLPAGGLLVQPLVWSADPSQKFWVVSKAVPDMYRPPLPLNVPMEALGCARVLASDKDGVKVGDLVTTILQWATVSEVPAHFATLSSEGGLTNVLPPGTDPQVATNVIGITGLTAWSATAAIANVGEGDVVLVSSAAGATGHICVQLSKARGATVIALTSRDDKAEWLKAECGADHTINYRAENVEERLHALAPDGITVFIDMVGGETLQAAINTIQSKGRIVVVGQMSLYGGKTSDGRVDSLTPQAYPLNLMPMVLKSVSMQAMLVTHWADQFDKAVPELIGMVMSGKIKPAVDTSAGAGIETLPKAFSSVFQGNNKGKVLTPFE